MLNKVKTKLPKSDVEVKISAEYEHIGRMYELMRKGVYAEWFVENDINKAIIRINTLKDVLKNSSLKKYRFVMDDIIDDTRVFDNGLVEAQTAIEAWTKAEDIILSVYGQFVDFEVYECDESGNC